MNSISVYYNKKTIPKLSGKHNIICDLFFYLLYGCILYHNSPELDIFKTIIILCIKSLENQRKIRFLKHLFSASCLRFGNKPPIWMALDIIYYTVSFYLVLQRNVSASFLADITLTVQNRHCLKPHLQQASVNLIFPTVLKSPVASADTSMPQVRLPYFSAALKPRPQALSASHHGARGHRRAGNHTSTCHPHFALGCEQTMHFN